MVENITDVISTNKLDNETSIAIEELIISTDLEGNDKARNKNKEKPLPDEPASFTPFIISAIDKFKNVKCKRPDIDAIYWYVSKTVATNVYKDLLKIIHVDNIEKENTIQNAASANEELISSFSITSENAPTISGNTPLVNCTDFNVNEKTIKNSAKILDDIGPPLLHNINTPILFKHGQSNTGYQL